MANLITLQDYKNFVGITNSTDDPKLMIILGLVEEFVETYCGRQFLAATHTEQLKSENGSLFLRNLPVTSVSKVTYLDSSKALAEVTSSDYIVYAEEGMVELFDQATLQVLDILKPFSITYTGGYSEVPAALKLAIMNLITYYHKQQFISKTSSVNVNISNSDDESQGSDLPSHIKRVLDLYRVI